jgi:adhesin transport system membrane fusion protein
MAIRIKNPSQLLAKMRRLCPRGSTGRIVLILFLFAAWASVFSLDVLVRGEGVVRVEMHNIIIQSQEGGVIRGISVKEGDTVKKGDLLAEVDNSTVEESVARTSASRTVLKAKEYRLQHELSGEPMSTTDFDMTEALAVEAFNNELGTYQVRARARSESESVLASQVSQREAEVVELRGQVIDLQKEMALQEQQVDMIEPMVKKGAAALGVLLQKRADLQRVRSSLNQTRSRLPRVEAQAQEVQSRLRQSTADFMSQAQQELNDTQSMLLRATVEGAANSGRKVAARIISPAAGVVHRVVAPHEGMVVKPGADLFELAPIDVPLIAEIKVRPEDRDHVWVGMGGKVRITALSGSAWGTLPGKVSVISPDAIADPNGDRFYLVELAVAAGEQSQHIHPGMGVQVFLEAGRRTVMGYLVKPLVLASQVALTEPGNR